MKKKIKINSNNGNQYYLKSNEENYDFNKQRWRKDLQRHLVSRNLSG